MSTPTKSRKPTATMRGDTLVFQIGTQKNPPLRQRSWGKTSVLDEASAPIRRQLTKRFESGETLAALREWLATRHGIHVSGSAVSRWGMRHRMGQAERGQSGHIVERATQILAAALGENGRVRVEITPMAPRQHYRANPPRRNARSQGEGQ